MTWRVGKHYGIHVYDGDRPVATFHNAGDARRAADAVNASEPALTHNGMPIGACLLTVGPSGGDHPPHVCCDPNGYIWCDGKDRNP